MAYTTEQLTALEEALASGTLRVTFQGRSIEYRSVAELKEAIAEVRTAMAAADTTTPRSRILRMYTQKGF